MSNTPGSCVWAPEYVHAVSVSVTFGAPSSLPPQPTARTSTPSKIAPNDVRFDIVRKFAYIHSPVNTRTTVTHVIVTPSSTTRSRPTCPAYEGWPQRFAPGPTKESP